MKKFIVNIIIFLSIVVVIDFAVGKTCDYMQHNAKGATTKRFDDLSRIDEHEVLILGSSRAHHNYVPEIISDSLGTEVYNAGYDGNGVILSYGILQLVASRYSPRLVIFDVEPTFDIYKYPSDHDCTRYLSFLKPYISNERISEIFKKISLKDYYLSYSNLYRYNSCCVRLVQDFYRKSPLADDGYIPLYGEMETSVNHSSFTVDSEIDELKLYYVGELLGFCNTSNIPIVVVASPKYQIKEKYGYKYIKDLCETYSVPFIDYSSVTEFCDNPKLFKEPMHMNDYGAKIFSSSVSSAILQNISY